MGVPQRRERVFFIALRKDLAKQFLKQMNLFDISPEIKLEFNEPEIAIKEFGYAKSELSKSYPSLF